MASSIRIKRRASTGSAGAPSSLLNGELAYNEADNTLYYGFGDNGSGVATSVISIAGPSGFVSFAAVQAANTVLAGPTSGTAVGPTFRTLAASDIPSLTAAKISDFDTAVQSNTLNSLTAPDADVSLNAHKITNLADPTSDTDGANKRYVDAARSGLDVKQSVRVATTGAITLSGTQTIDGVSLSVGDRVLVKNQGSAQDNGIYDVASTAWTRSSDADDNTKVTPGLFTFVEEGSANADKGFVLVNNQTITLGSTSLTFTQFTGLGQITAGDGLTKTGETLNVVGTSNRITANANSIDISANYVGQNTITTLGTITSGTWNANTLGVAYGGTGLTSAPKGSVLVANAVDTLTALDGGGTADGLLSYDASSDTISWSDVIDGGTF